MDAMRGIKHRGVAPLLSVKMEGNMRVVSRSRERRPTKAGKETQPPPRPPITRSEFCHTHVPLEEEYQLLPRTVSAFSEAPEQTAPSSVPRSGPTHRNSSKWVLCKAAAFEVFVMQQEN